MPTCPSSSVASAWSTFKGGGGGAISETPPYLFFCMKLLWDDINNISWEGFGWIALKIVFLKVKIVPFLHFRAFSHKLPDSMTPVAQRWATGGSTVGPPLAATGGPTSFWPVGQRWPNSGMPLLGHWWPNVGPPVAPPLGHRWQPPVGQRHFGQWANVGPTVACGMPVGPPVGQHQCHRWAND